MVFFSLLNSFIILLVLIKRHEITRHFYFDLCAGMMIRFEREANIAHELQI